MKDDIKKHFLGRDGFIWWVGQVAKAGTWQKNQPGVPVDSNEDDEYKGFGERYRVRIQGYHPSLDCEAVPDDALPWAYVMYPTTAGGGGRGSFQSVNITQGTFVFGWFIDGEDAQVPIIMGILGYNDYQAVAKQPEGCTNQTPVSGFDQEQEGNEVPAQSVRESSGGKVETQENATGQPNNDLITESAQGSNSQKEMASKENNERGKEEEPLAKPEDCEPLPTNKIQKEMQNLMKEMDKIQKSRTDLRQAISMGSADIEGKISGLQSKVTELIAGQMKSVFAQIEKTVIKQLNDALKPTYNLLHPNEQAELKDKVEKANDLIACVFKKLMNALLGMVGDMLNDQLGDGSPGSGQKIVNVPECYVNGMVGSIIGSQMDEINNEMKDILGQVDDFLSSIGVAAEAAGGLAGIANGLGGAGGAGGLGDIGSALGDFGGMSTDITKDLFSFLGCEENPQCPEVDNWSMWYGQSQGSQDIGSQISSAASNFSSLFGGGAGGGGSFDNLDFSDAMTNNSCDGSPEQTTNPIICGPPVAKISGGQGAEMNLVISPAGKVISVDLVSYGVNYSKGNVNIEVRDYCGIGHGGQVEPIIDDVMVCSNGNGTLTITYGGETSIIRGEKMISGNLGYYDSQGNLQPIVDSRGNPTPDCGSSTSIVDGIVTDPGLDYLPFPDGSQGGGGRVWADPDDTVITKPDGSFLPPVPPGVVVPIEPGGTITIPPTSTPIVTEPVVDDGGDGDSGDGDSGEIGGGDLIIPGVRTPIKVSARITTPVTSFPTRAQNIYPSDDKGSYPVILYLCEVIVKNSGFNYSSGDELVIRPDNGAKATPKFDQTGRVVSITVENGGEGFTTIPYIFVRSQTGYNAKFTPKFCIDRISIDKVKEPDYQDKIITVIDCVGKVT